MLAAVLASPPTTTGTRTRNKTEAALQVTGNDRLVIANLFQPPAANLPSLTQEGRDPDGWLAARPALERALDDADELLIGWGLDRLTGPARHHRAAQIQWVLETADQHGYTHAWTVGGEPRHPSRWHQYVADKYDRAGQGTFVERLGRVLVRVPLPELGPSHRTRIGRAVCLAD